MMKMMAGDLPKSKELEVSSSDSPQVINILEYFKNEEKFIETCSKFSVVIFKSPESQMKIEGPILLSTQKVVGQF